MAPIKRKKKNNKKTAVIFLVAMISVGFLAYGAGAYVSNYVYNQLIDQKIEDTPKYIISHAKNNLIPSDINQYQSPAAMQRFEKLALDIELINEYSQVKVHSTDSTLLWTNDMEYTDQVGVINKESKINEAIKEGVSIKEYGSEDSLSPNQLTIFVPVSFLEQGEADLVIEAYYDQSLAEIIKRRTLYVSFAFTLISTILLLAITFYVSRLFFQEIDHHNSQLLAVFNSTPFGIIVVDQNGVIIFANTNVATLLDIEKNKELENFNYTKFQEMDKFKELLTRLITQDKAKKEESTPTFAIENTVSKKTKRLL